MITLEERKYLMESMKNLLTEYNYTYTDEALNKIIDEWEAQKNPLIAAFKKHPNYVPGKFMIALKSSHERGIKTEQSKKFFNWIRQNAVTLMKDSLPDDIMVKKETPELFLPWDVWYFFIDLEKYAERTISEETATKINEMMPNIHAHTGQKTSRVVNKICTYLGYNKVDGYNREFAKYADSLSPITITRNAVLSLNPLDYLTMSFGNSWASCHTIDKENMRGMPNDYQGAYSSGTISYMLDPSSMVFYTIDNNYKGDEYWNEPKITRQMFHWGQDKLVQGRLYPQDNDYDDEAYAPNRNLVQSIMSTIFEFPNLWTLKKGSSSASRYIDSRGTHYRDYTYYNNCSLSIMSGSTNTRYIAVGADPICIKCGKRHCTQGNINHCGEVKFCACCGEELYLPDGDYVEIDGEYYCRDCVSYCECCGEYHLGNSTYLENYSIDVCNDCLENYYVFCECCDEWVRDYDAVWIDEEGRYICRDCLDDDDYAQCPICGEWHRKENMIKRENGYYYCKRHTE